MSGLSLSSISTSETIALISLVVAVLALGVAWWSVVQGRNWNKVRTIWDFVDEERVEALTESAERALKHLGIDINQSDPISARDAERIYSDTETAKAVDRLLTYFERFSAGVNVGAIDPELAYQFTVGRIVNTYTLFKKYIEYRRQTREDGEIFCQLETLATAWRRLKQSRRDRWRRKIIRLVEPGLKPRL